LEENTCMPRLGFSDDGRRHCRFGIAAAAERRATSELASLPQIRYGGCGELGREWHEKREAPEVRFRPSHHGAHSDRRATSEGHSCCLADGDLHFRGRRDDCLDCNADDHRRAWRFPFLLQGVCCLPVDDGDRRAVYGTPADLFGRKRVLFACTGIFLGGSTLCGFAPTMPTLVLFRVVQGLGVGAIQTLSNIILSDIHSPAERARVQGFVSMMFGAPAIGGPAIGAFVVENLHWSLVFWINLPIGAVSVLMYALFLDERLRRRDRQIDWIGCTLLAIGIGAGMLALAQARVLGIESIPLAILSVTAIVLLVRHER
jgi:hypothetical protein